MLSKPTYLPPIQNKKRKQFILMLVVFLVVIGSTCYFMFRQNQEDTKLASNLPTICDFDERKTKSVLENIDISNTQQMRDYFYYSETLTLLQNNYQIGVRDSFMGKQIRLTNLCDDNIFSFLLTDKLDGNIPVEELDTGFYVASIEVDLKDYYLISNKVISDTLYTINRNNEQKKVHLIADKDYFKDDNYGGNIFEENLVFIQVVNETAPEGIVDIVIDPAHMDQDFGPLDRGFVEEDYIEADKMFELSLALKEKLERYGLKVILTREKDEILNAYGNPGRVHTAYESQAKIMIEMNMEENSKGFSVSGSSYAYLSLPEMIANQLLKNTSLPVLEYGDQFGSFHTNRVDGLDYHNLIRESGGYSLGASRYSEISERLNQFAKDNHHGTQTIAIDLGNVLEDEIRELVDIEFERIVDAINQGILDYLHID